MDRPLFHIFLVHTPITEAIARGVIEHKKLRREDVIIFTSRNQTFPTELACEIISAESVSHCLNLHIAYRFWKTRRRISKFDQELEKIVSRRKFIVYAPQVASQLAQLLITSKSCVGFHYIEEGLAAYQTETHIKKLMFGAKVFTFRGGKLLEILCFKRRLRNGFFYAPGAISAYGVTEKSFGQIDVKLEIISVPWKVDRDRFDSYNGKVILVIDFVPATWFFSNAEYWLMLHRVANILGDSHFRSIVLRFRNDHPNAERQFIKEVIFNRLTKPVEVMDSSANIEDVCASANVAVVAAESSILLYAKLLGCKTYSVAGIMCEISKSYLEYYEDLKRNLNIQLDADDVRSVTSSPKVRLITGDAHYGDT